MGCRTFSISHDKALTEVSDTQLLPVLDLSMRAPPSPRAWGDQEDPPCPSGPVESHSHWAGPEDGPGKENVFNSIMSFLFEEAKDTLEFSVRVISSCNSAAEKHSFL